MLARPILRVSKLEDICHHLASPHWLLIDACIMYTLASISYNCLLLGFPRHLASPSWFRESFLHFVQSNTSSSFNTKLFISILHAHTCIHGSVRVCAIACPPVSVCTCGCAYEARVCACARARAYVRVYVHNCMHIIL